MKRKVFLLACMAGLIAACSQKQSVVQMPVSSIDVEKLGDSIDYGMDVSGLNLSDLRILRNTLREQGQRELARCLHASHRRTEAGDV